MTIGEASSRITLLVDLLKQYNESYYKRNQSQVSDYEYDQLFAELRELEASYPSLVRGDSPTQRVGEDRDDFFLKVRHKVPMLSLENTYSYAEVREFDRRVCETLGYAVPYVCELKYDGMAISVRYERGELVYAATRGNGVEGDNVTNNILQIQGLPHRIEGVSLDFEVRGEVYMLNSYFEVQALDLANKNKLKTPRNATSGTVKMHDPRKVAERQLQCVIYQYYGEPLASTHVQTLEQIRAWGFPVGELRRSCQNISEVLQTIDSWLERRKALDYDSDGVVVKVDTLAAREVLGATSHSPRWAIAYKYPPERKETKLQKVDFQVGRTGVVTPVALFAPIRLNHADLQKATLHNADQLSRLDLHEEDTIVIERAGEVIPKIVGVNVEKRKHGVKPIVYPVECPSCGTPLQRVEGQAYFVCPNHTNCLAQKIARTIHFASRDALDIHLLGDKRIADWHTNGLINHTLDLYSLTPARLREYLEAYTLKGKLEYKKGMFDDDANNELDKKSAQLLAIHQKTNEQLLDKIQMSVHRPVEALLFGLGVPNLGIVQSNALLDHFGSLSALAEAQVEEISAISNVGEIVARDVWAYFHAPENAHLIEQLTRIGFDLKYHQQVVVNDSLQGETVVVTGKLALGDRSTVQKQLRALGATVQSSVTSQTTILLIGTRPNDKKLKAAHEKGIRILTEDAFNDLQQQ